MQKKKVLIIGGQFGVYGHLAAWRLCREVEVYGLVASTKEKSISLNLQHGLPLRFESLEKSIEQADIISLAVPPEDQFRVAQIAIKYKKAIVFDKPLGVNLAQARKLATLCQKNKIKTCVNFEFPELETFRFVKKLIDDKRYGQVLHFFMDWRLETVTFKNRIRNWKTDPKKGGGFWLHYFAHSLNLVEWLFSEIKDHEFRISETKKFPATLISGTVKTKNKITGSITGTCVAQKSLGHRIEIHFEKASVILWNQSKDPIKNFELEIITPTETVKMSEIKSYKGPTKKIDSRALPMSKLFSKFIKGEKVPAVLQGLKTQEILETAKIF